MPGMKVLAGNWKMFKTRAETRAFFKEVGTRIAASKVRKIVAASPTLLETALQASEGTGIEIFSQNCAWAESGAFTGEISPLQLKDLGIRGTLVGHSERRQYFAESDETCAKRAKAALAAGLEVIYCLGETLDERKAERTAAVLEKQMQPLLKEVLPSIVASGAKPGAKLMIAYEPVWAIGTGLTATTEQIAEAHALLATWLKAGDFDVALLYGGSVKPQNIKEIGATDHVSGGLVGGASLEVKSYLELHDGLATAT